MDELCKSAKNCQILPSTIFVSATENLTGGAVRIHPIVKNIKKKLYMRVFSRKFYVKIWLAMCSAFIVKISRLETRSWWRF